MICSVTTAESLFQKGSSPQRLLYSVKEECLDFETIYKDNFAFVWRSLRGLGIPSEKLDDAAQDVFVVVHRKHVGLDTNVKLRSWLFGILRRVAGDYRRTIRRKGNTVPLEDNVHRSGSSDAYAVAAQNQALRFVESFAQTLNESNREIFVLAEIEQLAVPEVSEILEMNVNTVYSRLNHIRRELESYLSKRFKEKDGQWYE